MQKNLESADEKAALKNVPFLEQSERKIRVKSFLTRPPLPSTEC